MYLFIVYMFDDMMVYYVPCTEEELNNIILVLDRQTISKIKI